MKKEKSSLPIAVIFGGEGGEREISSITASNIITGLTELDIPVLPIEIAADGCWIANPRTDSELSVSAAKLRLGRESVGGFVHSGGFIRVRGAIPALHGELGEDGVVQGALRCAGISFIGSDTTAGAVLMDKVYTKLLAEHVGIPTVAWFAYIQDKFGSDSCRVAYDIPSARKLAAELGYPVFIKPARSGSSIGAGRAYTPQELDRAIEAALAVCQGRLIIERFIENPIELECAYLEGECEIYTAPGSVISKEGFYSFDKKYLDTGGISLSVSADVNDDIKNRIKDYSKRLRSMSGLRHLARFDYFLSNGELFFNEVNSFPGMTEGSLYQRMLGVSGVPFQKLMERLVSLLDGAQ